MLHALLAAAAQGSVVTLQGTGSHLKFASSGAKLSATCASDDNIGWHYGYRATDGNHHVISGLQGIEAGCSKDPAAVCVPADELAPTWPAYFRCTWTGAAACNP